MKSVSFYFLFLLSIVLTLAIVMCSPEKELEPYASQSQETAALSEIPDKDTGESTSPEESAYPIISEVLTLEDDISAVLFNFLLKFGIEPEELEITNTIKFEFETETRWNFQVLSWNAPFADITLLEEENRIEILEAVNPIILNHNETNGSERPLPNYNILVIDALGLDTSGYSRVTWLPSTGNSFEYRLYDSRGDLDIVIGRCIIRTEGETGGLIGFEWYSDQLDDDIPIGYNREYAVKEAATWLGDPGMHADHIDLLCSCINPKIKAPGRFCWEVVFDESVIMICSETGTIL